jgi:hypothetical protein
VYVVLLVNRLRLKLEVVEEGRNYMVQAFLEAYKVIQLDKKFLVLQSELCLYSPS